MTAVERKILRLVAQFLREYSDRLSTDGCNDWEWPAWFTPLLRETVMHAHPDADAQPDIVENAGRRMQQNWMVVTALAAWLEKHSS